MVASCCVESTANTTEITLFWLLGKDPIAQTNTTKKEVQRDGLIKYCIDDLYIVMSRYIHESNLSCLTGKKINLSATVVVKVQCKYYKHGNKFLFAREYGNLIVFSYKVIF